MNSDGILIKQRIEDKIHCMGIKDNIMAFQVVMIVILNEIY